MKIGLFIPCYINAVYPEVGVASYKLLKHLGLDVDYPLDQTCCGQPMANAGFRKRIVETGPAYGRTVPAIRLCGRSLGQLRSFRERKPSGHTEVRGHACLNSGKIYDICEFLHDIVKPEKAAGRFPHKVSIHNSCHGVRELHLSSPSEMNIPLFLQAA